MKKAAKPGNPVWLHGNFKKSGPSLLMGRFFLLITLNLKMAVEKTCIRAISFEIDRTAFFCLSRLHPRGEH